ncbi:MAG: response regulator [Caulobacter sp.]|nr:response regulator [Caulobacter sp.]
MIRILAVDDDPFIRALLQGLLAAPGRILTMAETGADGLAQLAEPVPDLVLLDLGLPDISGLEVLKVLRGAKSWAGVRILMLTASSDLENLVEAKAAGATGYICKPFEPDVLAEMVNDVLEQPDLIWLDDYTRARRPA